MSDFKNVLGRLEIVAAKHGWTLAVGDKRPEAPEQWVLILVKEDPARALFKDLGVVASEQIGTEDNFGG